ncbi:hypothetical protein P691DRAFT_757315 [Macrolepiota fuliginosa MF-IS2]|uniref:DRBM domain-containing protein n=1 Tax=Macrolepiota fuliginosa MF-IS2 TaxID=1400762 RepID=A0A9P5XKS7_9AGAR|nr:hypothetical protein P691DRAFT_757315 [Macrolepiota fuliginosa MF-IS2]
MPPSSVTKLHNRLVPTNEEGFISYEETSEGLAHNAIWVVKCKFKGEVKGVGKGATKSLAKEGAAKEALQKMGFSV